MSRITELEKRITRLEDQLKSLCRTQERQSLPVDVRKVTAVGQFLEAPAEPYQSPLAQPVCTSPELMLGGNQFAERSLLDSRQQVGKPHKAFDIQCRGDEL